MNFASCDERKAENGNFFMLPNVVFQLGLSTGELATYACVTLIVQKKIDKKTNLKGSAVFL